MKDISSDASIEECTWDGELREAQELFLNVVISNSTSSSSSESESGAACGVGNVCSDDLCCHPDTSTCGRGELSRAMLYAVLHDGYKYVNSVHGLLLRVVCSSSIPSGDGPLSPVLYSFCVLGR